VCKYIHILREIEINLSVLGKELAQASGAGRQVKNLEGRMEKDS
jgi:hypothetical protein